MFANETYRISGVDGIKWQAYNNRKGMKILRVIFTYKRIKRKKTKTYGLVRLGTPFRQGRSLWLPTLPFQKTNRYAVVGAM